MDRLSKAIRQSFRTGGPGCPKKLSQRLMSGQTGGGNTDSCVAFSSELSILAFHESVEEDPRVFNVLPSGYLDEI